jgi:hypothetical protein
MITPCCHASKETIVRIVDDLDVEVSNSKERKCIQENMHSAIVLVGLTRNLG